nr:hypothetical protein [Glycomyces xiaoerkulensis]
MDSRTFYLIIGGAALVAAAGVTVGLTLAKRSRGDALLEVEPVEAGEGDESQDRPDLEFSTHLFKSSPADQGAADAVELSSVLVVVVAAVGLDDPAVSSGSAAF